MTKRFSKMIYVFLTRQFLQAHLARILVKLESSLVMQWNMHIFNSISADGGITETY